MAQLLLTGALLHAGQDPRRPGWLRRSLDSAIATAASARGARVSEPSNLAPSAHFSAAARVQVVELPSEAVRLPRELLACVVQREPGRLCLCDSGGDLLPEVLVVHEPVAGERDRRTRELVRAVRRAANDYERAVEASRATLEAGLSRLALHPRLGSLRTKAARLPDVADDVALAAGAAELVPAARAAAERCKLDLATRLVAELPELHGWVGQRWCLARGEAEPVAVAVRSQACPADERDLPPEDLLGALVGVADRVDTLATAFAHGLAPTPTEDPLRLRVLAYGLLRTVIARDVRVDLGRLAALAMARQSLTSRWLSPEDAVIRMTGFLRHRLKVLLSQSFPPDQVHSALSVEPLCPVTVLEVLAEVEPPRA